MRPLAFALSLCAAALAACSGARQAGATSDGGVDERAARLYASKCSACHRPYEPASRTRQEWATAVGRMAPRAHLREADRVVILEYLQSHARGAGSDR